MCTASTPGRRHRGIASMSGDDLDRGVVVSIWIGATSKQIREKSRQEVEKINKDTCINVLEIRLPTARESLALWRKGVDGLNC